MTTHEPAACPVHADFDPLSPTFLADPFAVAIHVDVAVVPVPGGTVARAR